MNLSQGLSQWVLVLALNMAAVVIPWNAPVATAASQPIAGEQACLMCHGNEGLSGERNGQVVSLYITETSLSNSVHANNSCSSCHIEQSKIPHDPVEAQVFNLQLSANCLACHFEVAKDYQKSIHGQAGTAFCTSCHGSHDIQKAADPLSSAARGNIVATCNKCHGESPVAISYAESFHGKAVKLGSSRAATCVSCHGSHNILPPDSPLSSVASDNVPFRLLFRAE